MITLFIYSDKNTNIMYVVKKHQTLLYEESIATNVNKNDLIFPG